MKHLSNKLAGLGPMALAFWACLQFWAGPAQASPALEVFASMLDSSENSADKTSSSNAPSMRPWLIEVSSEQGGRRIRGSGHIVSFPSSRTNQLRYFLHTASHVAMGARLRAQVMHDVPVPLRVKGWISDNVADITWLELEGEESLLESATLANLHLELEAFTVAFEAATRWRGGAHPDFIEGWVDPVFPGALLPFPFWAQAKELKNRRNSPLGLPFTTGFGTDWVAETKLTLGCSGTPVIAIKDRYFSKPVGTALRISRHFDLTYFSHDSESLRLLKEYFALESEEPETRNGDPFRIAHETSGFAWRVRNGLLFREDPLLGHAEILPDVLIGNGGSADGGNGGSADGGNGGSADGGNGERLSSLLETDPWARYRIQPGIRFAKEPALALEAEGLVMEGSVQAAHHLPQLGAAVRITPWPLDSSFPALVAKRFGRTLPFEMHRSDWSLKVSEESIELSLLSLAEAGSEPLQLKFGRDGRLTGAASPTHRPTVSISHLGKTYWIDLRNFFFWDPYQLRIPFEPYLLPTPETAFSIRETPLKWLEEMRKLAPSLTYRGEEDGSQRRIVFKLSE